MTFTKFQACLKYFIIDALPSETTPAQFWERDLFENSDNLFKVLIYIYIYIYIYLYRTLA